MEVFDLGNNNLTGAFPQWFNSLPELQVLVLKSNKFHGSIGTSGTVTPCPKLRILDLSHNNFTRLLPEPYFLNFKALMNVDKSKRLVQYIGDTIYRDSVELVLKDNVIEMKYILTVFATIDLSYNNFRGEIPNDIGKLQGLRLLNLSHNNLSGHLPSLLGNLTMLESLDLFKSTHWEIPGVLVSLTFLEVFNLSKNLLVGSKLMETSLIRFRMILMLEIWDYADYRCQRNVEIVRHNHSHHTRYPKMIMKTTTLRVDLPGGSF
ncbi:receptor-like protein 32 [Rhododendron vialii]|uniref:receptor-like protein 32 n=1 Tax=Rhododendron vialii TaxID=182163 RepID=UPI00265EF48A|nr:receptor-like protein 32 [Rhododendron vialii]